MLSSCILRLFFLIYLRTLCVDCARRSSLSFVIDDTRSMWDDIEQVREAAGEIMNIVIREKASEIEDVVLVTFNDPAVVLRKKTSNKYEFINALNGIVIHNENNFDCPEYALGGIEKALQESKPGSYLFVFTDATAKDHRRVNMIKSLCEKKQSQVVFVLTGDCDVPFSPGYRVYHEIAQASNGQVFRVTKDDVKGVLNTIKETVKGVKSVVTSVIVPANPSRYTPVPFTVDDKTEYVIVSSSGRNVKLIVTDRSTRGGNVMNTERIMWKPSGKVVKFDAPAPGTYYAWVRGETDISIVVYARTDFTFDHGFSEFVPKSLDDASKLPIGNRKQYLSIAVTDPDHTVDIRTAEILDMNERVVAKLPLKKSNGDFYITDTFVSPSSMFKIQVTGHVKKTGQDIRRISKTAIEPQNPPPPESKAPDVTIAEGSRLDVDYNSEILLTCKVSGYPPPQIMWTSADGTILSMKSNAVELPYKHISYLKLSQVKNDGTYYCRSHNEEAGKFAKIDIVTRSPFTVKTSLSATTPAKYGEELKLHCDISSIYPIEIKWNTPLKPSDFNLSADKKVLTIKSIGLTAQGRYTCEATLKSDPQQKHEIKTNVVISDSAPPAISNATPSEITVSHGKKIHIWCKIACGVPRPSISWQVMKDNENVYRDISATGEEFIIVSARLEDAGQYRCIATNSGGQIDKITKVIVQKAPVVIIEEGAKKFVAYDSSTELTCKIVAFPLPEIAWKDSKGDKLDSQDIIINNEIISRLKLNNVKVNDTYSCCAENILGKTVSNIDISVTSPFVVQSHPEATTPAKFGEDLKLHCDISSLYPIEIKWNTPLKPSDFSLSADKKVLTIKSLSFPAQGKYTCEATLKSDPQEKHEIETNVVISDLAPPVISRTTPSEITVSHGLNIHIWCKIAGGVPRPIVSWQVMKNNENVYRDIISASGEEFIIVSATLEDAGQYRCIATNSGGQTAQVTKVIVKKAPEVIIEEGAKQMVTYDSSTELTCRIVAFPLPDIAWKDSKGNKLDSQDTVTNNGITSLLNLHNVKVNDTYSCFAENILGKTVSNIDITVSSPLVVQSHPEGIIFSTYGEQTSITCGIKSIFPLKIRWFLKNYDSTISEIHTSDKYLISPNETTLHILFTDLNTVGKYVCEASLLNDGNQKVNFTTKVEIDNLSPPILQNTEPKIITVQNEDKVKIPCKILGGIPLPIISWQVMRKDDNTFRDLFFSGQELTLGSATLVDAGQYRCMAKNSQGQAYKSTELIVQKAPEASIDEGKAVTVLYGSTIEFKCRIIAFPKPDILSFRDSKGNELTVKNTIENNYEVTSQLKIQNINNSETYSCYAKNNLGKTVQSIKVLVSSPIDFASIQPETTRLVNYKDPVSIACDARSSFPMSIKWFYQKNELSEMSEIHTSDKYTISPDKRTLHIISTDLDLVGKYTCEASLSDDENQNKSFTTKVEINNLKAPEITDSDKTVTAMNGQRMTAVCKANGIPKPYVTWEFKSKASNVFTILSARGERITNPNMGYEWAGAYKCTATNAVGTQSRVTDIIVHGEPKITNANSVYFGVTGDKVLKIPCDVAGVPEPVVTWKHEDKVVTSDNKITVDNNSLFIKNPTEKDSSNFTCEAKNKYGNAIKKFEAAVSDFVDEEDLSNYIYLKLGESKNIQCLLPHSDPQSVRWYVNNEKTKVLGSFYSLKNANFSNDGNYTCRVNTDQGSESQNYVVDVGYGPSFTTSPSPTITWNGNKDDILDCNVRSKPKVEVEWFYNGKQLNGKISELAISGWGAYTCKVSNVHGSLQHTFNVTSDGCQIDRTVNRVQNTPLIVGDEPSTWPNHESEFEFLTIRRNQIVTLECSTQDQPNNVFKTHPNAKILNAECNNEDKFIVDGKTYKFEDLQCKQNVKPSQVYTKKPCMENGEIIEVGFKRNSGFLGIYEVCYSKVDHKTLYTKVVMSDVNIGNIVGPSFNLNEGIKTGKPSSGIKKCQYNKRWLVSPVDVAFGPAQTATLSDKYNAVPVFEPCDGSYRLPWSAVEKAVQSAMYSMFTLTAWTGASQYNPQGIPRYLWKVAKFEDDTFGTIVYVNDPIPKSSDILCPNTAPEKFISLAGANDQYTYTCSIEDFKKAFKVPMSDFDINF